MRKLTKITTRAALPAAITALAVLVGGTTSAQASTYYGPIYGPVDCGSTKFLQAYGTWGSGGGEIKQYTNDLAYVYTSIFSTSGFHQYAKLHSGKYQFGRETYVDNAGYRCVS